MSLKTYEPHKSSLGGMDANIMALLSYLIALILNFIPGAHWFSWLVPLIIYLMEKDSQLVKFHAAQAFVLGAIGAVIYIIFDAINAAVAWNAVANILAGGWGFGGFWVAWIVELIVGLLIAIAEIIAMINAYQNKEWTIPLIGGLTEMFKSKVGKAS